MMGTHLPGVTLVTLVPESLSGNPPIGRYPEMPSQVSQRPPPTV